MILMFIQSTTRNSVIEVKKKRHRVYLEKRVDKMLSDKDQRAEWERIGL